jgi:cysteine desulfurase
LRDASRENPQEVITTPVEHPSVLSPLKKLAEEGRIEIKFLPINSDGILQIEALKDLITDKTALVSVMLVNNELGTLYPLQKISEMCSQREKAIPIHCDAIQAVGRIGVLPGKLGVDSISLSAHKFYGPKGVGALWAKQSKNSQKNSWLIPRQWGGGQEAGIRAGTENLPGIVGFGIAARIAKNSLRHWQKQIEFLRDQMEETILARIQGAQVNGGKGPRIYSTSNIHFPGVPGDVLQQALDIEGIAVSTGSACSSGTVKGSHVLRALGQNNGQSAQAIRISLGKDTSVAEIQKFQDVLFRAVQQIREAF